MVCQRYVERADRAYKDEVGLHRRHLCGGNVVSVLPCGKTTSDRTFIFERGASYFSLGEIAGSPQYQDTCRRPSVWLFGDELGVRCIPIPFAASVGWGYAYAKFIAERKPGAKVVYMYLDIAVTRAISAGLKYEAPRSKINVLSEVVFPQGSTDATVQAAQVAAMKPDFVLVGTVGAFDITLTNQLLDLGFKTEQLIHILGPTPSILGYGKRSVGSFYGTFFDANLENVTPAGQQFVKEYTEQVGRIPSFVENYCFITPYIIKAAIEKAGVVDREKFREALSSLKMIEPTLGVPVEFDKNGARKEYMYMMEILSVSEKSYTAKKVYYLEWDPEVIPVYDLVK